MRTARALWLAVIVAGVVLVVFPIATGMFSKTTGVEKLTGDFRASFDNSAVTQTRADMNEVLAMSQQLQTETLPALPDALGMSPDDFNSFMATNYPDVADGLPQLDPILARFDGLVSGVEAQAPNFREADKIPTSSLSSKVVPWLFLIPGLILVGVGLIGIARLARSGARRQVALLAVVAVIGVGLAGGAVGLSVYSKGQAVDEMTKAFAPVFSDEGVAQMEADMAVIQKMTTQLESETLPGLALALSMSPDEFGAFMTESFPAVAAGLGNLDATLVKFDAFIAGIGANIDSFEQAADLPTAGMPATSLFYWLLVPGLALLLLSGGQLLATRQRVVGLSAPQVANA